LYVTRIVIVPGKINSPPEDAEVRCRIRILNIWSRVSLSVLLDVTDKSLYIEAGPDSATRSSAPSAPPRGPWIRTPPRQSTSIRMDILTMTSPTLRLRAMLHPGIGGTDRAAVKAGWF
jgi:hypothetical protein